MNSPALETDEVVLTDSGQTLSRLTGQPFLRASQSSRSQATTFVLTSDLPQQWRRPGSISVLETSLGFGARLIATLCLWRKTLRDPACHLHYTALEAHPLSAADMQHVLQEAGFEAADFQSLLSGWPHLCAGVHRIPLPEENVTLTLFLGDTRTALSELSTRFDRIFLSGPNGAEHDKESVSAAVCTRLAWLASPGCHLVSGMAFQTLKRALGPALPAESPIRAATDAVDGASDEPNEQMWSAPLSAYPGRTNRVPATDAPHQRRRGARTVAIIGAGIAGLAAACRLQEAGLSVTIIDAGASSLLGGSAQAVLAGHVHFSRDENLLARLTRNAQTHLARLPGARNCPRWQIPVSREQADSYARLAEQTSLPRALLRSVTQHEAMTLTGWELPGAGLWQADSQILFPQTLRDAILPRIASRFGTTVGSMHRRDDGRWLLRDTDGDEILSADSVVICTARPPDWLAASVDIPVLALAGQSQRISGERASALRSVIGSDTYACPLGDGSVVTGSTWRELSPPPESAISYPPQDADQALNLSRWRQFCLAGRPASDTAGIGSVLSSHAGVRFATPDRLPLIGAVPDRQLVAQDPSAWSRNDRLALPVLEGIYMAAGFGSRGALWSALAASLITDLLAGAPVPLEKSLADAIAPQRFLRQRLRHNQLF